MRVERARVRRWWGAAVALCVSSAGCGGAATSSDASALRPGEVRIASGASCGDDAAPTFAPPDAAGLPPETPTMDTDLARVARAIPGGFGGVVADSTAQHVLLVDPTKFDSALAALRARPGNEVPGRPWDFARPRKARWSFDQIHEWSRHLVARGILADTGIVSIDTDEARNRIVVGVRDAAARERVLRASAAHSLPCDLIILSVEPGIPSAW